MKKILFIILIVMVSSCAEIEEIKRTTNDECSPSKFYVAFDNSEDTKVYIDETIALRWNENDQISVFGSSVNEKYTFDGKTGDKKGSFTKESSSVAKTYSKYYAVFPYSTNNSSSKAGTVAVIIPSVQKYSQNTIDPEANLMVAMADSPDDVLKFKNVCGYIRFKVFSKTVKYIKKIVFIGNHYEVVAGPGTISSFSEPKIALSDKSKKEVILDCGKSGVQLGTDAETATEFWLAVLPQTFATGFTITLTDNDNKSLSISTLKSVIVERSHCLMMQAVEYNVDGPAVGISKDSSVPQMFVKAVKDAGGIPVVFDKHVTKDSDALTYLENVDAMIITGGYSSGYYNDPNRDDSDLKFIKQAVSLGMPLMGVCHGHQLIAVGMGGQRASVSSICKNPIQHHYSYPSTAGHNINIEECTLMHAMFGTTINVNSYHTMAISKLPTAGLSVTARAEDGIIEAIEGDCIIGTQFHPEMLYNEGQKKYLQIFEKVISWAREYKSNK